MTEQETKEATDEPVRDRPFNPWRQPRTSKMKAIVDEAIKLLQNYEKYKKLRKRGRRKNDQETFEATVSAVLCDLVHLQLTSDAPSIFITRSNQVLGRASRYRPTALNKKLPLILDLMATPEMAFAEQEIGEEGHFGNKSRTTIRPGWRTLDRIAENDIDVGDVRTSEKQEIIELKASRQGHWDKGHLVDYEDNDETRRLRKQLSDINTWLDDADIRFDPSVLDDPRREIDDTDRALRRVFTQGSFDCGGRLWGGFWMRLGKDDRRRGIDIDGERVVELDYGQTSIRIAYGLAGAEPSFADAYTIPGFERHRAGIKLVINAMLFTDKPLSRMPKGGRKEIEKRYSIGDVVSAILDAHHPIADFFFKGIGHQLQRIESDILVDVLLQLKNRNLTALPIHDAVLVPFSRKAEALDVMKRVFEEHAGTSAVVTLEGSPEVLMALAG